MNVAEWLDVAPYKNPIVRYRAHCSDGFSVSIQVGIAAYCAPRRDSLPGVNYTEVELGYPSAAVPEWIEYAEDEDKPVDTVYAYVPVELVDVVLAQHGGIVP